MLAIMRALDTDADAEAVQLEVYRRMTPAQRVMMAAQMSEDVRTLAIAGIRRRHPAYSIDDATNAYLGLTLGAELFMQAFPDRPQLAP